MISALPRKRRGFLILGGGRIIRTGSSLAVKVHLTPNRRKGAGSSLVGYVHLTLNSEPPVNYILKVYKVNRH